MKSAIAMLAALTILMIGGFSGNALAQQGWSLKKLDATQFPVEIVEETRKAARNGLPDGLVETAVKNDIRSAWYSQPTTRYTHAILGDDIEAGALHVEDSRGRNFKLVLPKSEVFEDRAPRIADLDGDGSNEVITIRSSVTKGASVTIYGLKGNALIELATTGFIGRANRWLNIAAVAPLLGTRANQIAFVSTPHIGGTLHVVRYIDGKLISLGSVRDFSNHVIGSREMRLSAIADVDGNKTADLILPSADRKTLRIMGFRARGSTSTGSSDADLLQSSAGLKQLATIELPSPVDKAIGLQTEGQKGFLAGLENGEVYLVHP